MKLPASLSKLIEHFESLPGIGTKTAERLAFYFLKANSQEANSFADSLIKVKENLSLCKKCGNVAEKELCEVCLDPNRNTNQICVVENVLNLIAIEKTGYNGVYHILHGVLNPINGVNIEDINLNSLFQRIHNDLESSNKNSAIEQFSNTSSSFVAKDSVDLNDTTDKEPLHLELILATNPTMEGESTALYIKRRLEQDNIKNIRVTRIGRGIPTGGDIEFADKSTLDNALQSRKDF